MNWGSKIKKNVLPVARLCFLLLVAFFLPRLFLKKPSSTEKKILVVAQSKKSEMQKKLEREERWRERGRLLAGLHQLP